MALGPVIILVPVIRQARLHQNHAPMSGAKTRDIRLQGGLGGVEERREQEREIVERSKNNPSKCNACQS